MVRSPGTKAASLREVDAKKDIKRFAPCKYVYDLPETLGDLKQADLAVKVVIEEAKIS